MGFGARRKSEACFFEKEQQKVGLAVADYRPAWARETSFWVLVQGSYLGKQGNGFFEKKN